MNILLIYNVSSGNGKFMQSFGKIKTFFKLNNFNYDIYDVRVTDKVAQDIERLAPNYDVLTIAGGDGTIHSVINGLMSIEKHKRPKLLVLPFGTTNDYATMLGLGKDLDFNLALLKTNHYRYSDVYRLNNEYFVYAAAAGKFSNVSYDIDRVRLKKLGSIGYLMNAKRDLLNKYHMDLCLETSNLKINRKAFLILIASGSRVGGFNIRKFTKDTKFNDGKVNIRIFTRNHVFSWMKIIWFYLFKGRYFHNDIHITTDYAKITLPGKYIWNVDGEAGPTGEIIVKTLKEEIEVYVHPKKINKLF